MSSASQTALQLEVPCDPVLVQRDCKSKSARAATLAFSLVLPGKNAYERHMGQQQRLFIKLAEQKREEKPDSSVRV